MLQQLCLLTGLSVLTVTSQAQSLSRSSTPRVYLGADASLLTLRPFKSTTGTPQLLGPSLTLGTQLSPRWAVQLSGAYFWRTHGYYNSYYNAGLGVTQTYTFDSRDAIFAFPLLAHYTLTSPRRHLQLVVAGGVTYLRTSFKSTFQYLRDGQLIENNDDHFTTNQANLTLGPCLRYALTGRLALTAEALANYNLNYDYPYLYNDHFFTNLRAGLQIALGG